VPTRGPFVRVLLGVGVAVAASLALIGGVALRVSGVVAVLLAGAVAACLAAGVARETPGVALRSAPESAVQAAGWTVGSLFVLSGTAALGGGLAAVLTGAAGAIVGLLVWLVRSPHPHRELSPHTLTSDVATAAAAPMPAAPWHAAPAGRFDAAGSARLSAPLTELPTADLGREWLRTTAALAGRLEPAGDHVRVHVDQHRDLPLTRHRCRRDRRRRGRPRRRRGPRWPAGCRPARTCACASARAGSARIR